MDVDQLRAAIGNNADRYVGVFERIAASGGRWVAGWNWAAFVHSTAWFCYRRMYGWAVLNLIAPWVLLIVLAWTAAWIAPHGNLVPAFNVAAIGYLAVVFILVPVYADALYLRRIVDRGAMPPSGRTALGAAGFVVVPPLVVLILIPSYGDYTPRAKVSEAVLAATSLRNEIDDFYRERLSLPIGDDAARFRSEQPSRWVERIVYDAQNRRLVVTLRDIEPGKRFALVAREEGGELRWACRTIDLDRKYLPPHCRE